MAHKKMKINYNLHIKRSFESSGQSCFSRGSHNMIDHFLKCLVTYRYCEKILSSKFSVGRPRGDSKLGDCFISWFWQELGVEFYALCLVSYNAEGFVRSRIWESSRISKRLILEKWTKDYFLTSLHVPMT